jgi:hypothetical protein
MTKFQVSGKYSPHMGHLARDIGFFCISMS